MNVLEIMEELFYFTLVEYISSSPLTEISLVLDFNILASPSLKNYNCGYTMFDVVDENLSIHYYYYNATW